MIQTEEEQKLQNAVFAYLRPLEEKIDRLENRIKALEKLTENLRPV